MELSPQIKPNKLRMIGRMAGLPISVLHSFGSRICVEKAAIVRSSERKLATGRAALADEIYHRVAKTDSISLRRLFLDVRRECFNGKTLDRFKLRPDWPALCSAVAPLVDGVIALEQELALAVADLTSTFTAERQRERDHLHEVVKDSRLVRGIALASPVSVESLERLRSNPCLVKGRRESRLETTLLRYVSRAAFKTSPYSTLTRLVMGELQGAQGAPYLQGNSSNWQERSLLRLKRYLLDQCWDLLRRYPMVRRDLAVLPNNTLEEISTGIYRLLRPGFWDVDENTQEFRYLVPSIVKIAPAGHLTNWFLQKAVELQPRYSDLIAMSQSVLGLDEGTAQGSLDQLLHLGFLCLMPPWPAHEGHLEKAILQYLQAKPFDAGLRRVTAIFEQIVEIESSFATNAAPARAIVDLERLLEELWAAAAPLGGIAPEVRRIKLRSGNFYEDVLLVASDGSRDPIAQVPLSGLPEALENAKLLWRFTNLYSQNYDFLHTLEDFAVEHWPGRTEVSALEVIGAIRSLWQEYARYTLASRLPGQRHTAFNPRKLAVLEELQQLRLNLLKKYSDCLEISHGKIRLCNQRLRELLSGVPACYSPSVGPCLFLQSLDMLGTTWVLNRLYEGTGRYTSRYTSVMEQGMRQSWTSFLSARSWDDEGHELLDLTNPQGDTLNVHSSQTSRRLVMPGDVADVPRSRCLHLRNLRIRFKPGSLPRLVDDQGRQLTPVHLGVAGYDFLPSPLKMLAQFGPGDAISTLPLLPSSMHKEGDLVISNRITMGNLVVQRKRWFLDSNPLNGVLDRRSESEAFALIDTWRRDIGLPDQVVFIEKIHHESRKDLHKPQYIDFTSPLFANLFSAALRENSDSLTFEEILPSPEVAPRDSEGRAWSFELIIDSLAFSPARSLLNDNDVSVEDILERSDGGIAVNCFG